MSPAPHDLVGVPLRDVCLGSGMFVEWLHDDWILLPAPAFLLMFILAVISWRINLGIIQ